MALRFFNSFLLMFLLSAAAPLEAHALGTDVQRAQAHLDAARALIPEKPLSAKATKRTELAELEVEADRPEKARETGFLVRGIMQDDPTKADHYIHLIARIALAQDKTQDAANALEQVAKPDIFTKNIRLEVTQQLTRRFGLQRGVTYAREHFPDPMSRRDVYCKLCYTLAANGNEKTAREFIDISLDLTEIFGKLDAYRFAAFGLHTAGDSKGAAAFLEDALQQAEKYPIATTRVSMLSELAVTFDEIGQAKRALEVIRLAEAAAIEIEPDNYARDSEFERIAEAYALMRQHNAALHWVAQTKDGKGNSSLYKRLVEQDLKAGNEARARQLNKDKNVYFGSGFETRVALAKIERGDSAGALADFTKMLDGFGSKDWCREAGAGFARMGQHTALAALLAKIETPEGRYNLHLGAAEGYLDE